MKAIMRAICVPLSENIIMARYGTVCQTIIMARYGPISRTIIVARYGQSSFLDHNNGQIWACVPDHYNGDI
jgi:hypothetical protein